MAIIALDGTQSHKLAAPPTTSRSMSVTCAPSLAAVEAACTPAGPPPITTKRTVTCRTLPPTPVLPEPEVELRGRLGVRQHGRLTSGAVPVGTGLELGREDLEPLLALAHPRLEAVQNGHPLAQYGFTPLGTGT